MRSSAYWKKRFELLEQAQNQLGVQCCSRIEQQYRRAQRQLETQINAWYQRFADNNGVTMQEARRMLTNRELAELRWDVNQYIQYGEENAINGAWMKQLENASARYHISRLEALKLHTQQSLEVLFGNQLDTIDAAMKDIYTSGYYHTAFEIQKGLGVAWDFATLDEKSVQKVINRPWAADGRNFSERIWTNRQKLVNELNTELTRNIILGQDPQKAIDAIARKMGTSKANAGRLVMTEEAFFSSAAQKDAFNELGVEQYRILATLDSHTSEICQEMDGKVYPMKDYEPGVTAPPFHVRCRTTTVPHFEDEFDFAGERAARDTDGKTYHVPADMTYPEWEKSFVDGDKSGLQPEPSFMDKKELIYKNEQTIDQLQIQKKNAEMQFIMANDVESMGSAQKAVNSISDQIESLKTNNKELQESLGLPTNAKERFYNQEIDYSVLPQDILASEYGAISSWTRTGYTSINNYKRFNDRDINPDYIREADALERMIDRNSVQETFTVKRGTDFNAMNHLFGGDSWKQPGYNVSGEIICDKGFLATSPDIHGGFSGNIQMYIDVPKGAKGVYIGDLSAAPDEKEFLLQCGTELQVDRIEIWYDRWNEANYDIYMKVKVGD